MHPYILHFGRLILPTFGVLAAVGLMAGLSLSLRTAAWVRLNPDAVWNAGTFTILSAFVVSRLLLVMGNLRSFLSYPLFLLALPSLTATGIVLTMLATALYLRRRGLPLLRTLDAWAPCATLVWAFLALGHLAEGSDPGLITAVRWSFPSPSGFTRLHPIALYAALAAMVITAGLLLYLRSRPVSGRTAALALAASGVAQFVITFFRQPNTDDLTLAGFHLDTVLDPIQWLALAMVAVAFLLLLPNPASPHSSFSEPSPSEPRKPVSHAI